MHTEVQVALKFVISFLYNKLPRRRVNLFGEELDTALKDKFQDHWYPDKPFKGSAYRCLKITDPADPVLNRAARQSGNPLGDIIENLPADLAVWIDPGEVSYRMGEKGAVKILYSEKDSALNLEDISPEVRGFLSLDTVTASMGGLSLSQQSSYSSNSGGGGSSPLSGPVSPPILASAASSPPAAAAVMNYQQQMATSNPYQPRQQPVVYTAASFAQTKFGSTKLKTNSKKPNRMSPTEFSNYIKQRALQKSLQQQQQQAAQYGSNPQSPGPLTSNGFNDKFFCQNNGGGGGGGGGGYYGTNSNLNFNNFPKSATSPGINNSNDFCWSNGGMSSGNQNQLSPSPGLNLTDYTTLFTDWENETETNAFLHDILASTSGGGSGSSGIVGQKTASRFDDWMPRSSSSGPTTGSSFNSSTESGLTPDSRSSSTKSMASETAATDNNEGFNQQQRVLVAN